MEGKSRRINDHFNPIILRNVLTRNWYKPIIVFLAVFGTTFLYLRYKKPIYESKAVLQLLSENKTQKILEQPSNIVEGPNLSEQIELLKNNETVQKTTSDENGYYKFVNIPLGSYVLKFIDKDKKYLEQSQSIEINSKGTLMFTLFLLETY